MAERLVSLQELTREPISLFDKGVVRKTDKSAIIKTILKGTITSVSFHEKDTCFKAVILCGALEHRVLLSKSMQFKTIALKYVDQAFT